jgi:hypothetical protein
MKDEKLKQKNSSTKGAKVSQSFVRFTVRVVTIIIATSPLLSMS